MSAKEKNLFERELQKDPFAEEAADGLSSISPVDASADMSKLYRTLESRVKRSRRFIIYRIAASIAVLMIISSVFIVLNRNNAGTRLSETTGMPIAAEIQRNEPIVQHDEGSQQDKKAADAVKNITPEQPANAKAEENDDVVTESADVAKEEAHPAAGKIAEPDIVREYSARSMKIAAEPKTKIIGRVEGTVYSAEDDTPVPGASIVIKGKTTGAVTDSNGRFSLEVPDTKATLVASYIGMLPQEVSVSKDTFADIRLQPSTESLSEVVVVGYGVQKKSDEAIEEYVPPRPVTGQAAFNRYIEDNMVRPDSSSSGQRAVVVVGFHVLANGAIDSLKIIRSPGKAFSDEAIRLVKSGPRWQPAIRDGVRVEDDVRIRIVFK
jgi:TonB family protein